MLMKYVVFLTLLVLAYGGGLPKYYKTDDEELQVDYIMPDEPIQFHAHSHADRENDNMLMQRLREKREASPGKRTGPGRERGRGRKNPKK